jgi:hypothetical protein
MNLKSDNMRAFIDNNIIWGGRNPIIYQNMFMVAFIKEYYRKDFELKDLRDFIAYGHEYYANNPSAGFFEWFLTLTDSELNSIFTLETLGR